MLLTDLYALLTPGYWVMYSGEFVTQAEATDYCTLVQGYDCDAREVRWFWE